MSNYQSGTCATWRKRRAAFNQDLMKLQSGSRISLAFRPPKYPDRYKISNYEWHGKDGDSGMDARNTSRRVTPGPKTRASKFESALKISEVETTGVYDAPLPPWQMNRGTETRVHQRWFSSQPFITPSGVNRNESNGHRGRKAVLAKAIYFRQRSKNLSRHLFFFNTVSRPPTLFYYFYFYFFLRLRDNGVSQIVPVIARAVAPMDLAENAFRWIKLYRRKV